jgi:hypothetical protein
VEKTKNVRSECGVEWYWEVEAENIRQYDRTDYRMKETV